MKKRLKAWVKYFQAEKIDKDVNVISVGLDQGRGVIELTAKDEARAQRKYGDQMTVGEETLKISYRESKCF